MKNNKFRILCFTLILLMLVHPIVGCKKGQNEAESGAASSGADTLPDDGHPDIERCNYGRDFNILYPSNWSLYTDYYFSDEENSTASKMSRANYTRMKYVEDYLGITFNLVPAGSDTDDIKQVSPKVKTAHMAGDDSYQLVLTHCYIGVVDMAVNNYLADFNSIDNVDLEADYWLGEQMESLEINGNKYLGISSFILHDPCVILFNKDTADQLMTNEGGSASLYESVRNRKWTLESMKLLSQYVSSSQNDGIEPERGTYGFTSNIDWELCAFMASCGYLASERNADGTYELKKFNNQLNSIFEKVYSLMKLESSFGWEYNAADDKKVEINSGRTLFSTSGLQKCITYTTSSEVKIGILPYPMMEEGGEYKSLDWAGFFVIPNLADTEMSGAVVELLSYCGKKDILPEYYDVLLGLRVAKAPEDAEMLDIIFSSLVYDPTMNFLNNTDNPMKYIFYIIPNMIRKNNTGIAGEYNTNYRSAKTMLDFSKYAVNNG